VKLPSEAMVSPVACGPLQRFPCHAAAPRGLRGKTAAIGVATVAVFCVLILGWTDRLMQRQMQASDDHVELIYLPPVRFLRAASLGYRHALADILWFRTISYFGRHYRSDRLYPWLAYMCDVVTDLDPEAQHVYRFGGLLLPWEADRVDDGVALLEKGTRNMPDSWELAYMLGFSYYFFKDDLSAAAQTLERATLLPGAPSFVVRLAALIGAAQRGPARAIEFLSEIEGSSSNEEIRGAVRERIRELELARDIDTLQAAVGTFQARAHRLPSELHELVAAGLLTAIPAEPFGGTYLLDAATGRVHSSSGHEARRLSSSKMREKFLNARGVESGIAQERP
jgi:hypothetical protein